MKKIASFPNGNAIWERAGNYFENDNQFPPGQVPITQAEAKHRVDTYGYQILHYTVQVDDLLALGILPKTADGLILSLDQMWTNRAKKNSFANPRAPYMVKPSPLAIVAAPSPFISDLELV